MNVEIKVVKDIWNREKLPTTVVLHTEVPNQEAKFAMSMIERWGMVAGIDDGEDSAGRSRIRLTTVEELVSRACETSVLAMSEFRKRGWILKAPGWDEMERIVRDEKEKEEA